MIGLVHSRAGAGRTGDLSRPTWLILVERDTAVGDKEVYVVGWRVPQARHGQLPSRLHVGSG